MDPQPSNLWKPHTSSETLLLNLGLSTLPSAEDVFGEIEAKLLLPKAHISSHWLPNYQLDWQHHVPLPRLFPLEPSLSPTCLEFVRSGLHGYVTGYTEVPSPRPSTGLASTSLDRAPGPSNHFVRGKTGYIPFWPGGMEDVLKESASVVGLSETSQGLRAVPPGFARGLRLPGEEHLEDETFLSAPITSSYILGMDPQMQEGGDGEAVLGDPSALDHLLPDSTDNLNAVARRKRRRTNIQKRDWAHVVDVNKPMPKFHELVPDMAHKYPFELDTFQKEAVYHLEMGDSVFVAAHTSAGKTVVAEYAIALAIKHMTRAIYTSPIKALSNQKYRDFKQTFSSTSVGILTGDVQINPEASCLIMTTEILRSMLYKGADLIRDVEFVIFDEVHYVNDAERGVVWEEVIILLPDHVNIILLSATVPNSKEFAEWVGRTKKKDIYVISTAKRPVPLEHFLYAGRELYKIVSADRQFLGQGYKDAGEALRRKQDKEREVAGLPPVQRVGSRAAVPQRGQRGGPAGRGAQRGTTPARGAAPSSRGGSSRAFYHPDKSLYVHLLGNLRKRGLLPVVVFTFSKKRCEENAGTLTNVDICNAVEKSEIHVAIEKALSRLKEPDRQLPQIRRMRELLSRGIGVHHGGLLPIVKEVVEILFARGLVKVLFATETFAMGVNMPAKCVVFSHIRKHDGRNFRDILPGEYTQMAGRAGRRGLDSTGTVIIVANDELPEQTTLQTMILGTATKLQSQFRLTYNMILNLLRVEALRVEEMIKRSFSENATQRSLPDQQRKVVENEKELSSLPKLSCDICTPDISQFYGVSKSAIRFNRRMLEMVTSHPASAKVLCPGRVVILQDGRFACNLGVVLRQAPIQSSASGVRDKVKRYDILVLVDPETKEHRESAGGQNSNTLWPPEPRQLKVGLVEYDLKTVPLQSIALVSEVTIKVEVELIVLTHRITPMKEAVRLLGELVNQWAQLERIPEFNWKGVMRSLEFQDILSERNQLASLLPNFGCVLCPQFHDHYAMIHIEESLKESITNLKMAISDQNLELIPDYEQRVEVLQELRFIDENSTVLLKGRVACEINSASELVLTELILENTLAKYEPEEVVALLSCFVFQEKTEVEPVIPPRLQEGRDAILVISGRVETVQARHKVPGEDFRALKFGLVEVVYEWAKGMPFQQITELTDVPEGTIVRVITRLDETCREVRDAARVIGDAELFKKMEEAQTKIKRDIVFAASLYF